MSARVGIPQQGHRPPQAAADTSWMQRAACADTDPESWFPLKSTHPSEIRRRKQLCNSCPVRGECLEHALRTDQRFGIWGGLTERERRRLVGTTPGPPGAQCGTAAGFQRHRRRGEAPCGPCRDAKSLESGDYWAAHADEINERRRRRRLSGVST